MNILKEQWDFKCHRTEELERKYAKLESEKESLKLCRDQVVEAAKSNVQKCMLFLENRMKTEVMNQLLPDMHLPNPINPVESHLHCEPKYISNTPINTDRVWHSKYTRKIL